SPWWDAPSSIISFCDKTDPSRPKVQSPEFGIWGPGSFDALRRVRHDEQGDVAVLPVLWRLANLHDPGGFGRVRGAVPFRKPGIPTDRAARDPGEAGVCPPTAHAGLRRPVRGRIPLPRPLARSRGHRCPPVHLHRDRLVLDDPPVAARGRRDVSQSETVTELRAGRGRTTPGPPAG